MERSPLTSGRSATPADINRYGWPTSIGTGGRHQSECPADIIGMRNHLTVTGRFWRSGAAAPWQTPFTTAPTQSPALITGRTSRNGTCAHLGARGCTVYEHRPSACRSFDCCAFAAIGLVEYCDPEHRTPDWEFAEDEPGEL